MKFIFLEPGMQHIKTKSSILFSSMLYCLGHPILFRFVSQHFFILLDQFRLGFPTHLLILVLTSAICIIIVVFMDSNFSLIVMRQWALFTSQASPYLT